MFSANSRSLFDMTDYMLCHKLSFIIVLLHNMKEVALFIHVCIMPLGWAHLNVTQHTVGLYYSCFLNYYFSC